MKLPQPNIGTHEVLEMIRGYNGENSELDPIVCLQQAEGTDWKLDACRFLLSQALTGSFDIRERSYLTECAAMNLASVFDVLLHEIVHYYGLSMTPKEVRWDQRFRVHLANVDTGLVDLLKNVKRLTWFRKAMGLRHYVTHHGGLLQLVAVSPVPGMHTYSLIGDEYFDQEMGIERPESFRDGHLDREALLREILNYMCEMCRVVDRVRLHCFNAAPMFEAGRRRQGLAAQLPPG
ncbi:MAG: hypothetical protein JSR20_04075 [Nitrospira sp.]|nr:hypothetical protein [Nitrospira sp.]